MCVNRYGNSCSFGKWNTVAHSPGRVGALCDRALSRGKPQCTLNVNVANPSATRVYERLGFREIARACRYVLGEARP